jgi:hypothetical protein
MPLKPILNVYHRRPLATVIAIVSIGILLGSCKQPPGGFRTVATTWVITVHATPHIKKPTHTFTANPDANSNGCIYATSASGTYPATGLTVCLGDTIQWQGEAQGHPFNLLVVLPDKILNDASGNASGSFATTTGSATPGGAMNSSANKGAHYEWYVSLLDTQTGETHDDDPKIIIGH